MLDVAETRVRFGVIVFVLAACHKVCSSPLKGDGDSDGLAQFVHDAVHGEGDLPRPRDRDDDAADIRRLQRVSHGKRRERRTGRPLPEVAEIMNASVVTTKVRAWRAARFVEKRAKNDALLAGYVGETKEEP